MQLPLVWANHLSNSKDKEDFEKSILAARHVLRRLLDIVESQERGLTSQENSIDDFDSPSWAMKQAFRNGSRSNIKKVRDLLAFTR